jgi:protein arginine kinase activator
LGVVGTLGAPRWLGTETAMKCQKCEKPATFHITELTGGAPEELHLCEDCAHQFLTSGAASGPGMGSLAGALAQQLAVSSTAEQLAELDRQVCPMCGISFYEFRKGGRLGCPHDYVCFAEELEPLLLNIHGENIHAGKQPKFGPLDSSEQTTLIRLRKEMQEAVAHEEYERASQLRDQMRNIQQAARAQRPRD